MLRLILGCALLAPLLAWGQFRAVPGREYREYHNPVNPVRGEAVVGLSILPSAAAQRASAVRVLVPSGYSGEIRLETLSADGRFRGEGAYAGSAQGKDWVTLPVATPADNPRPADPKALAIAARVGKGVFLVAQWGDGAVDPGALLRLYVNGRRADMFVRAGAAVVPCKPVGVAQPVRFDKHCDIALSQIPHTGKLVLIRRDQFDEQSQEIELVRP